MTFIQSLRRTVGLGGRSAPEPDASSEPDERASTAEAQAGGLPAEPEAPAGTAGIGPVEIAPNDPLLVLLQSTDGVIDVDRAMIDSPALDALRAQGIAVIVPLVAQGELVGALYLGERLSEQGYSTDDRRLLASLAARTAPAIRVAQLVREQATEVAARERLEQELQVATLIQQQFLPRSLPDLPDWQVAAYYGPARAVGGDFYDFIELPDGRVGVVVGDVTDKGVPAALVMARTHSVLRAEAPRLVEPGAVLARANAVLCEEMPANMFVTCLYGVLEPSTGRFVFANAGHNLPYLRSVGTVDELRATGMPLGLLPGMAYEEAEAIVDAGQGLLLYSDGFVEAHAPDGEMYGFPRLRDAYGAFEGDTGSELVDRLLDELHAFTGRGWEQEDDLTLVALRRSGGTGFADADGEAGAEPVEGARGGAAGSGEHSLLDLEIPGEIGNERIAMDRVAEAVAPLDLAPDRLERLKTAVSEAAMNAIEHGSQGRPEVPIRVHVTATDEALRVRIADLGLGGEIPLGTSEVPDLEAKLAGEQTPRGWGLFLIEQMVDELGVEQTDEGQAVVLVLHLKGAS
jgi:serine phosphatase RsbU (regulator of sigma subunit)/anti-sigma regulatory factor (Ser/Thr protein kinase)